MLKVIKLLLVLFFTWFHFVNAMTLTLHFHVDLFAEQAGRLDDQHNDQNNKHDGIGSIPGAFLGGILLGIIENLSKAYISTQLSDAIVFVVLIVVLIVKPTGLLGKKVNVKELVSTPAAASS